MNGLAIDSCASKLTVAAKKENDICTASFDLGMRQSELLVPAIDYTIKQAGLLLSDLDYTTLSIGPGSFTGLRLSLSALKAIQLSYKLPIYGISSLQAFSHPYQKCPFLVLSLLDANKDRFYARLSKNTEILLKDGDYSFENILNAFDTAKTTLVAGPGAQKFMSLLPKSYKEDFFSPEFMPSPTDSLFLLAEEKIRNNEAPLKDYDAPVYLRASEAEIKLSEKL